MNDQELGLNPLFWVRYFEILYLLYLLLQSYKGLSKTSKSHLVFGQRPQQGTKSCRLGRNSVCMSDHLSIHPPPPLAGPQTLLAGPQTMLAGPRTHSRKGILHNQGRRSRHSGPKTTRYTPKIAAVCIVRLLMFVYNPPVKISLCRAVFCSLLPHLSLGWAYRTPMAIGAPTAAPKRPEIPLRLLRFALSAFWC